LPEADGGGFGVRGQGYAMAVRPEGATLALRAPAQTGPVVKQVSFSKPDQSPAPSRTSLLQMRLEGANPDAAGRAEDPLPGRVNYFLGNDPKKWRTDVPTSERVRFEGAYRGVDMVYYGNQRQLQYDFIVAPGADPNQIALTFEGAKGIRRAASGDLLVAVDRGEVAFEKPFAYQEVDGEQTPVDAEFRVRGGRVTFALGRYDRRRELTIDPVLAYSTYLGGSGGEDGRGIAVDAAGNAYVTGYTSSTDFPTVNAFQATYGGGLYAFVTKLNAAGSGFTYSTYLGGGEYEEGRAIAVDAAGNAYVTGYTQSTDFPTVTAFQATNGGGWDAFVTKLNASGSGLVYSTYLGGSGWDFGNGLAADSAGNAYVTGYTISTNFPTANAFQATYGGSNGDAFVTKLHASGSGLVYSTYLGGSRSDVAMGLAVDAAGNAYVTGKTESTNFPTATAFQATNGGYSDVFVTKLNAAGSGLVYSTYLGGGSDDRGFGIAVDAPGNAYVTGYTQSTNFPTANAFQATHAGGTYDAFVTKLNASGSALVYSTYLGGNEWDEGHGIAVNAAGNTYVTGETESTNFPTAHAFQGTYGGSGSLMNDGDAFLTKLNASGSGLAYSTYLGGGAEDYGRGIAADAAGNAYVTGNTKSTNFPTANAFQETYGGGDYGDAFVAKISEGGAPTGLPDVHICNSSDAAYVGDNVYNTTGANQTKAQTVTSGTKATYVLKVENDGNVSDSFKVTGTAGVTGWTITYYDAVSAGTNITAAITGTAGWTPAALAPGAVKEFRVEVTPATTVAAATVKDVLVTAMSTSDTMEKDTVKASTTVPLKRQPDCLIRKSTETTSVGDNVYNTDGRSQTKAQVAARGVKATYVVSVQNDSNIAMDLRVTGTGSSTGWSARYFDAATGGTEISNSVTGTGWWTPVLNPGAATEIRLEVTAAAVAGNGSVRHVLITAMARGDSTKTDTVKATTTVPTPADLVVTVLTITPQDGGTNTPRTVTCTVKNVGTAATPETRTALWLRRTSAPQTLEAGANRVWVTPALAAGATTTLTWTFTPAGYGFAADVYTAVALADWAEQVAETNENNNRRGATWAIYDLIVSGLAISPQSGDANTVRTVTCVVKNIGGGKTPETRTALWLKRTSAPQPLETGANRVWVTKPLVRMETVTLTWTFTPKTYGVPVGSHTAVALADWAKQAAEGSETNNNRGYSWQITATKAPPAGSD